MEAIVEKLQQLAQLQAAADVMRLDYEEKRAEILKAVQAELDALDDEYKPLMETLAQNSAELEAEIKQDVLQHGGSIKGDRLHAVFVRGRVLWDTQALDRYAREHPEVQTFRREGTPSVQLRVVS